MSFIKLFYLLVFIITVNCSGNKVSNYHGVKSLDAKFEIIQLNTTNKNDLINLIGPPSFKSDFNNNKWFYLERQKTNQSLFKLGAQKIKKNNILIVELNPSGILINKKLLNLNDMNDIKYLNAETNKEFKNKNAFYDALSSLREKVNAPLRNKK